MNLTYDPDSWPFAERGTKELKLRCMRIVGSAKWKNVEHYGRACAADMDYAALPDSLPDSPWDERNMPGLRAGVKKEEPVGGAKAEL